MELEKNGNTTELANLLQTLSNLPKPLNDFHKWFKKQKDLCETIYDFQADGGKMEANWSSEKVEMEGLAIVHGSLKNLFNPTSSASFYVGLTKKVLLEKEWYAFIQFSLHIPFYSLPKTN